MKLVRGGDWAGGTVVEREVGTRKQTRDESRAEPCGAFMAVIRWVLSGSEKGIGKGTAALYSPPWGVRWSALHKRTAWTAS